MSVNFFCYNPPPTQKTFGMPLLIITIGVMHLVCMQKGGRGSQAKAYAMHTMGLTHLSTYAKKSIMNVFCNILISKILSSYFVVFSNDFHYCPIKHLLRLVSCLSNFYSPFLYGIIDWKF